jgi:formamidopyrimidine-DNA glycosylase
MPELPELEVIKQKLRSKIKGKQIQHIKILKPYVLRNVFGGDLSGDTVENVARSGKYLVIQTSAHDVFVHLMLRGSLQYVTSARNMEKSAAAVMKFADGTYLQFKEKGHKKRMAICIMPKGECPDEITKLGVDPLTREFSVTKVKELLAHDSMQLKSFLCDQRKIAGIGNAYADEILWKAGLSPFKLTATLTGEEAQRLHRSIVTVITWAVEQVNRAGGSERRDFLNIHGKKGSVCPECGDIIRTVSFSKRDTYYCPTCQTRGKVLKDRRISKFYR